MIREIRGRHVALGFGFAFSVITGVNLLLATQAVRTFPGLEVKNSMSPANPSTAIARRSRALAGPRVPILTAICCR